MPHRSAKSGLGIGLLAACLALPASAQLTAAGPDLKPIVKTPFNGVVKVRNAGSATAGPSAVTVECNKLGAGGGGCPEVAGLAAYEDPNYPNKAVVEVPALKPGKTFTHKLSFWNSLSFGPGVYQFTVIADDGNKIAETNEGNNTAMTQVTGRALRRGIKRR
ncbi:MAG: CARDB domain-containing protein [bacterium]